MPARRRVTGRPEMPTPADQLARSLKPLALVRVTVPSVDRSHRSVSSVRVRREIEATLLAVATGTTTFTGLGTWKNGGTRPIREKILIVESYMPATLDRQKSRRVADELSLIARRARQEALFVVVNGRPFLLPGS
jgi:hypothetical protein